MDVNFIQNIVVAILFAYFIILCFKSLVALSKYLTKKIILFLNSKKVLKNIDQEFIDFLKEQDNVK